MTFNQEVFTEAREMTYGPDISMYGTPTDNHTHTLGLRHRLEKLIEGQIPSDEPRLATILPVSLNEPNPMSMSMIRQDFNSDKTPFPDRFVVPMKESIAIIQMDTKAFIEGHGIVWIPRVVDCLGLAARSISDDGVTRLTAMHISISCHYGSDRVVELIEPHKGARDLHLFCIGMRLTEENIQVFANHEEPDMRYDYTEVISDLSDREHHRTIIREHLPTVKNPKVTITKQTGRKQLGRMMTAEYLALSTLGKSYYKVFSRQIEDELSEEEETVEEEVGGEKQKTWIHKKKKRRKKREKRRR